MITNCVLICDRQVNPIRTYYNYNNNVINTENRRLQLIFTFPPPRIITSIHSPYLLLYNYPYIYSTNFHIPSFIIPNHYTGTPHVCLCVCVNGIVRVWNCGLSFEKKVFVIIIYSYIQVYIYHSNAISCWWPINIAETRLQLSQLLL